MVGATAANDVNDPSLFRDRTCARIPNPRKELPVIRDDKKVSGYIRMEQQRGLIGIYEKENPNSVWHHHAHGTMKIGCLMPILTASCLT